MSTDCLGRGHDIPRVRYVINYDAPDQIESYVHRVGRTGRAGEQGFAMSFLMERDHKLAAPLIQVLRETEQKIPPKLHEMANLSAQLARGSGPGSQAASISNEVWQGSSKW